MGGAHWVGPIGVAMGRDGETEFHGYVLSPGTSYKARGTKRTYSNIQAARIQWALLGMAWHGNMAGR